MEQIRIHIHRAPHVTAEDFGFLHDMLRQSSIHIYAPESDQFDGPTKAGYESIASGNTQVYRDVMSRTAPDSMLAAQFKALFAVRKPLAFFDINQQEADSDAVLGSFGKYTVDLERAKASQLVEAAPANLQRGAKFIEKRDAIIARNVLGQLPARVQGHPRLRSQQEVGVLMTIGDSHQLIDKLLKSAGLAVETNPTTVFEARQLATNEYLEGGEPSEDLITKSVGMTVLRGFVRHRSTLELRRIMNDALEGFTLEDIDEALRSIRNMGTAGAHGFINDLLTSRSLDERGLELVDPRHARPAIKLKQTPETRNGIPGIRTSMF